MTSDPKAPLPFNLTWDPPKTKDSENLIYKVVYRIVDSKGKSEWVTLDKTRKTVYMIDFTISQVSEFGTVEYFVKAMRECEIDSDEHINADFARSTTICSYEPTPPPKMKGIRGLNGKDGLTEWFFRLPKMIPADQKGT